MLKATAAPKVKYDAEMKKMCKKAISGSKDVKDKEDKIVEAFKAWDSDKNGVITKDELEAVLTSLACSTKPADLDAMLKEADLDADGKINYEEMVQWLCRAPHMEQYFLTSLDIFKRNFKETDVAVLEVQKAMVQLQKEFDESAEDDTNAMKKCLSILKKLLNDMEAVQKISQKRIDDELTPIIKRSFKYHDKDNSGTLSYDESIIFFSNFISLWESFGGLMSELNAAQMAMLQRVDSEAEDENLDHTKHLAQEKAKLVTPDKLHQAFKSKYAVLKGERVTLMEEKHKAAFEVLSKDGKISETAVVEALLHGHEKNAEFLDALGLYVEDVMKSAELQCKELKGYADGTQQALNEALGEVDASAAAMGALGAAMTAGAGQQEMDPGDCEVQ